MNARARLALIAMTTVYLACHAASAASAPQSITKCQTISKAGSYVLENNLEAMGTCLVVDADFVTIDLAGFMIQGNGTGYGITDWAGGHEGTTLRNGTVTKFYGGIHFTSSIGVVIERISAINNANVGMGGITVFVRDSIAMANGGTGISVGPRSLVSGSISTGNGSGIVAGLGSTLIGNTIGMNANHGIAAMEGVTIVNNTSRNNPLFGIGVHCPSLVMGNAVTANGTNLNLIGAGCTADHNAAP